MKEYFSGVQAAISSNAFNSQKS